MNFIKIHIEDLLEKLGKPCIATKFTETLPYYLDNPS